MSLSQSLLKTLISCRILLISVFIFMGFGAQAQFDFNERCVEAYIQILNFRFDSAHRLLEKEKKQHPDNLIPLYLENTIDFFTLFTAENRLMFESMKQNKSMRLAALEKGNQQSPYYRFCMAGIKLQWALVRIKFGEYATAGFEVKSAYALLEENREIYPDFIPDYVGLGILHVILGLVPENYQWLTRLVGMDGSIDDGRAELQRVLDYKGVSRVYRLFKPEACFYLAFIDSNILQRKKESLSLIDDFDRHSENQIFAHSPLLAFARSSIWIRAGKNDEAMAFLSRFEAPDDAFRFAFLDYMQGLVRLQSLDLSASLYFERFINDFEGINYIKSAHQKLAWCYLLQGDTTRYKREIALAGRKGYAIIDEDKQAYSEYNVDIIPAIPLLKARLLFDGGYYSKALDELLNTSLKTYVRSRKDLTEYTYRLARIYHGMGNESKAVEYYTKTISYGRKLPHYYAASSALNLGLIYEFKGDYAGADTNFRLCSSLKHDEYENSLRQKAKAGLNRLKKSNP